MELVVNGTSWWGIDPHVHCRDEEQSYKTTVPEVLDLAHEQGVGMIFDMPNPQRPVTNQERIWERLALVPKAKKADCRLLVGLTGDKLQVLEALWCYDNIPEVVGLKMFVGRSVGDLSVSTMSAQRIVWRILSKWRFKGVVDLHCEKESLLYPELWDPSHPMTHTLARPERAEVESVQDQIDFALEVGYKGRIHICHVSCPQTVMSVYWAKKRGLRISCGVTPHHIMWDESRMTGADGLKYKMNPPLRRMKSVLGLRAQLCAGMIDLIETDHAVHTADEKAAPQCLSGYPSLTLYRYTVTELLPSLGLTVSAIKALTYNNVIEIFGDKLR